MKLQNVYLTIVVAFLLVFFVLIGDTLIDGGKAALLGFITIIAGVIFACYIEDTDWD